MAINNLVRHFIVQGQVSLKHWGTLLEVQKLVRVHNFAKLSPQAMQVRGEKALVQFALLLQSKLEHLFKS